MRCCAGWSGRFCADLDGIQHGDHRSAYRGTGVDMIDLRAYEADDDVRHIDWNVTARMDEPYVREFAEDRELAAWLLVDRSSSMTLGPIGRTKERLAVELAVSLARLLGRGGSRVGAMVLSDDGPPTVIRARAGRRHTLHIATELLRPVSPSSAATDLDRLLLPAAAALKRRSAVFIVLRHRARVGARPANARQASRRRGCRGGRSVRA